MTITAKTMNPLRRLADHPRREALLLGTVLAVSSAVALAVLAFRICYSGRRGYAFQSWNLFLAWIPLWLALAIARVQARQPAGSALRLKPAALALGVLWLLFLPNAPYLITEFVHLHPSHATSQRPFEQLQGLSPGRAVPLWYDVMLILVFAWNGLLLGLVSLDVVRRVVRQRFGNLCGWSMAVVVIGLSAFGISLGRFQRWNSWDVFFRPGHLLSDVASRLLTPWAHPRTAATTVLMATFLLLAYLTLVALMNARRDAEVAQTAEA
jgi:uncharacterized membrane protein